MTIFLCIQIKNDNKKAEKTFLHANHSIEFMEIEEFFDNSWLAEFLPADENFQNEPRLK